MKTLLRPCKVPWVISPSMSGVTLHHMETDVEPECTVVFGGGRRQDTGRIDRRRIELTFGECWFARVAPRPDDKDLDAVGFEFIHTSSVVQENLAQFMEGWQRSGYSPYPGFYVAVTSAWLGDLPDYYQSQFKHYVVSGRDGYVELIARNYSWREWFWPDARREDAPNNGEIIGEGSSREDDLEH